MIFSRVENGKLNPHANKALIQKIGEFEGKGVIITVQERKSSRSLAQNRLMWLWLTEIAEQSGFDKDSLHEYFKRKFLGMESQEVMGEVVEVPASTTKLKVGQMADYLTQIEALAMEQGFVLTATVDYRIAIYGDDYA